MRSRGSSVSGSFAVGEAVEAVGLGGVEVDGAGVDEVVGWQGCGLGVGFELFFVDHLGALLLEDTVDALGELGGGADGDDGSPVFEAPP